MDTESSLSELVKRPVPTVEQLQDWQDERRRQRAAFVERAQAWQTGRGTPVVSWPEDEAAIMALGVPCEDCVTVVTVLEGGRGRPAHHLRRWAKRGDHWAAWISVVCGTGPAFEARRKPDLYDLLAEPRTPSDSVGLLRTRADLGCGGGGFDLLGPQNGG